MLRSVYINNIALIKSQTLDFCDGFNVLSGETGAGKSIIIDALSAVLGHRVSRELIRTGTTKASVGAVARMRPSHQEKPSASMASQS